MALAAIVKGRAEREEETTKEKSRGAAMKAALTDLFTRAAARRETDRDDDDEKKRTAARRWRDGGGRGERPAAPQAPRRRRRRRRRPRRGMDGVTIPLRESLRKMAAEPAEEDRAASRTERRGDSARVDPTYASTRGGGGEGIGGWSHAVEPAAFHAARPGGRRARTIAEWVDASGLRDDVRGSPDRSPAKAANAAPKAEAARSNLN